MASVTEGNIQGSTYSSSTTGGSLGVGDISAQGTTDTGVPYMVMDRLHGQGVDELLAQSGRLDIGRAVGIVVQAAVLIPFLRAGGYRFRPRWDFRHTGLGKTFRLAKWTLGFVLVSQGAYVVVSRLATEATVDGRGAGLLA